MKRRLSIVVSSLLTACAAESEPFDDGWVDPTADLPASGVSTDGETMDEGTSLEAYFQQASEEFGVPVEVLKAVAWAETGWQWVRGEEELDGWPAAHGIMALRGEQLVEGAERAGVHPATVETNPLANIRAAAALLAAYGAEDGARPDAIGSWARAVAHLSGIESDQARAAYVHGEVFSVLQRGMATESLELGPTDAVPEFVAMDTSANPGPDYGSAVWRPSPNHSARPSTAVGDPSMVIIHTCEGSYSGCWGWLANGSSGVSAHYVVNADGSEVSQLVRESRKAWHIGATYDCDRNGGKRCDLDGYGANNFTIGIEHAGYASQSTWNAGLLQSSARLVCDVARDQGIAIDKYHVVGHGQLQPYNRVDPGGSWPWESYLSMAASFCNGTPLPGDGGKGDDPSAPPPGPSGTSTIVVDSNNASNGGNARCLVSGNWTASNNVSGYYNTGYFWRSTGATSDLARFEAYLDAPRTMAVDVWYPAAADRSSSAPFVVLDAEGNQLDVVYVDQKVSGGQWVTLGTYAFTAGWNAVALSRWTAPGDVVVADAVRFREANG